MYKNKLDIITLNKKKVTDFAFERNELIKKSKAEWILFVDSDEKASAALTKEISSAISNKDFNGYYIYRKNYFLGKYIGTDKIVRLAKKGSGKWKRGVHEVWSVKGSIGTLKNPLIHNTAKSLFEYIDKINKYSSLHAKANKLEGKKSSLIKIILFPKLKFIQSLISGRGTIFSILQAFHSFLAWSELWLSQKG